MTQNSINNSASILDVDNIRIDGNTISSTDTNGNIILAPDGTGVVSVTTAPIVPSGDRADSLESATNSWDNVYCDGISFDDGTKIMANYEKGTFTPKITYGAGDSGITYSTQQGIYWRIGDVVFCNIVIILTNKGTSTGGSGSGVRIETFPYTVDSSLNVSSGPFPVRIVNTAQRGSNTQFIYRIENGTSTGLLQGRVCGDGTNVVLRYSEITNTSEFYVNLRYVTDEA